MLNNNYFKQLEKCIIKENDTEYYSIYAITNMLHIPKDERYKVSEVLKDMMIYLVPLYGDFTHNYLHYRIMSNIPQFRSGMVMDISTTIPHMVDGDSYEMVSNDILVNHLILYTVSMQVLRDYNLANTVLISTGTDVQDAEKFLNNCINQGEIFRRVKYYRILSQEMCTMNNHLTFIGLNTHDINRIHSLVASQVFGHSEKVIREICNIDPNVGIYNHGNTIVLAALGEIYHHLNRLTQTQTTEKNITKEVKRMTNGITIDCEKYFSNAINNGRDSLIFPYNI